MLYGIHKNGRVGGRILRISRAIVLQSCEQCRWRGAITGWLTSARKLGSNRISCKGQVTVGLVVGAQNGERVRPEAEWVNIYVYMCIYICIYICIYVKTRDRSLENSCNGLTLKGRRALVSASAHWDTPWRISVCTSGNPKLFPLESASTTMGPGLPFLGPVLRCEVSTEKRRG